jgi:type I restriction enzyme S subunit
MNAERLLAHYARIADAPDAIPRMRRFVLDLAVRGKLVPQDPSDESPIDALKQAREQLEAAAATTGRLRWKASVPAVASEMDKDVPSGWIAARVNDTGLYVNGPAFRPSDWKKEGLPIIRIQNLTDHGKEFNFAEGDFPNEVIVRNGDLLVSWSATLEAFKWDRGPGVLNQHIFRVIPAEGLATSNFLLLLLRNAIREMADSEHAHGLVMTHINREPFVNHLVLIPPLAEQHRIVAKVNELMALCDQLEAARAEREATRDRLMSASLARLDASDPETFQADARLALDALPALTTRPDQIKQLRQTILNLAVRGKLVPQDPNDEPASELLARLTTTKSKGRKGRDWSQGASSRHVPAFEPPLGWSWTTIDETAHRVTVGYVGPMRDQYVADGVPFLRSQNVRAHKFREEGLIYISPGFHKKIIKSALAPGDVVVVRSGNVGTACVIPPTIKEANCSDLVVVQKPECVLPKFLCFYLNSLAAAHVEAGSVGVALTHFNTKSVATMPLALPPLAEQRRIVAKVDELMVLCDQLEASLATADDTRRRLLKALLAEALAPAAERELAAAE